MSILQTSLKSLNLSSIVILLWFFYSLNIYPGENGYLLLYMAYTVLFFLGGDIVKKILSGHRLIFKEDFLLLGILCFLLLLSLVSVFNSDYKFDSLKRVVVVFFPVFLVSLHLCVSPVNYIYKSTNILMSIILMVTVGLVIVSCCLYFFGAYLYLEGVGPVQEITVFGVKIGQKAMGYMPFLRVSSFTGNPNTLGMLISISLIIAVYFKEINFFKKREWGYYFIFIVLFLGLLLTISRGAFVSLFFGFSVYFLVRGRSLGNNSRNKYLVLLLCLVFFIFVIYSFYSSYFIGSYELGRRLTMDLSGRNEVWSILFSHFKDTYLLGAGFGVSGDLLKAAGSINDSPHNSHLHILVELGVLGYLSFFLLLAIYIYKTLRFVLVVESKKAALYSLVTLSIVLMILVNQFVESSILRGVFLNFFLFYMLFSGITKCDHKKTWV
ncbi:O-antigen ligase family protein [Thiopseudomonas alkaliphila]|uniref:O-antigen ligase family protein n=1 Tax=Thiopseudomonas alkaliphila TaxID=1697053 RepID=A0AAW7DMS5_9GAMM|nr:O-antigen ligase family protein [Thiopseudomonas alkaliphila]MDM1695099.1 O-antigen ligase family protein [Thiopseudomonas alkaliphila]